MIPFRASLLISAASAAVVIGSPLFDWTDPNPLGAHRWWRIGNISPQSGSLSTVCELYLKDSGGTTLTGTWTAWNSGNGATSNLTDGNAGTFWGDVGGSTAPNRWLLLDMGSGHSGIPATIEMTARTGFQSQTPSWFDLQYSDDGITFTNATNIANAFNWDSGARKIFWVRPYIVQFYFDDPINGSFTTISELEVLNATPADLTVPYTTDATAAGAQMGSSNDGSPASNAFNNVTGSDYTGNSGALTITEYRFTAQPAAFGVSVNARSSFSSQAPRSFKVRCSRDGYTYHLVYQSAVQAGWGSNERRVFTF